MAEKLKLEVSDEIAIKVESMNKWFGSFHDGTEEAHELMKQRRKRAHALT